MNSSEAYSNILKKFQFHLFQLNKEILIQTTLIEMVNIKAVTASVSMVVLFVGGGAIIAGILLAPGITSRSSKL